MVRAYVARGFVYVETEKYDRALASYQRAIELDSRHAGAYYYLGLVLVKQGNKQKAIVNFKTAANLARLQGKSQLKRNALNELNRLQQK